MKSIICLTALASILILASTTPDAQRRRRGGGNMFSDFHKVAKLAVGENSPAMHANDSEGVELDIAEYRGQWVFIEFGSYT